MTILRVEHLQAEHPRPPALLDVIAIDDVGVTFCCRVVAVTPGFLIVPALQLSAAGACCGQDQRTSGVLNDVTYCGSYYLRAFATLFSLDRFAVL